MSDVNAPDTGGGEAVSVVTPADDTGANISVSQAARALQSARFKKPEPESAAPATDPEPVSAEADDAQPQADPVETTEEAEPAAEPPIEPPRSWTKEAKERWQSLPRETQEYIADREQEREREFRRSQNEAAEKLKGLTAKEQAVEQVKQQYEAALPALMQTLRQEQAAEFGDIQSMDDVKKLAAEDPFRFSLWQAHQMKVAAVRQEAEQAQARQSQEKQQQWSKFAEEQDKLAIERIPDLSDKTKASKLQDTVAKYLEGIGFSNEELGKNWNGERVFRDARMQQILLDAARYADLKAKPPVPTRPVPQVQRPGVSQPRGASDEQAVQHLNTKFERTGNLKDAAALLTAKRAAARR